MGHQAPGSPSGPWISAASVLECEQVAVSCGRAAQFAGKLKAGPAWSPGSPRPPAHAGARLSSFPAPASSCRLRGGPGPASLSPPSLPGQAAEGGRRRRSPRWRSTRCARLLPGLASLLPARSHPANTVQLVHAHTHTRSPPLPLQLPWISANNTEAGERARAPTRSTQEWPPASLPCSPPPRHPPTSLATARAGSAARSHLR